MKKIDIVIMYLALSAILFAQPGKSRGPGGQYTDRMEMMRVWKMTEYLELNEGQAEKLFPAMRNHQKEMRSIMKKEKELYTPLFEKAEEKKNISKKEMNDLMDNLSKLNNERASIQMDFVKKTGTYLEPYQQMKLLVFEPYMKEQVKTKMRDGYMRPKPKNKKRFRK